MSAPPVLQLVATAPSHRPVTEMEPAADTRRRALGALVARSMDALRAAARAGLSRSVCACETLCAQIEGALEEDDATTACLLLECVAKEPAARTLLPRLFTAAGRLARSDNPFIVYRACTQVLALGRRDLRLDNHAGLLVGTLRAEADPALARRLGRLLEDAR